MIEDVFKSAWENDLKSFWIILKKISKKETLPMTRIYNFLMIINSKLVVGFNFASIWTLNIFPLKTNIWFQLRSTYVWTLMKFWQVDKINLNNVYLEFKFEWYHPLRSQKKNIVYIIEHVLILVSEINEFVSIIFRW